MGDRPWGPARCLPGHGDKPLTRDTNTRGDTSHPTAPRGSPSAGPYRPFPGITSFLRAPRVTSHEDPFGTPPKPCHSTWKSSLCHPVPHPTPILALFPPCRVPHLSVSPPPSPLNVSSLSPQNSLLSTPHPMPALAHSVLPRSFTVPLPSMTPQCPFSISSLTPHHPPPLSAPLTRSTPHPSRFPSPPSPRSPRGAVCRVGPALAAAGRRPRLPMARTAAAIFAEVE